MLHLHQENSTTLRILLTKVKGPSSYEAIRTVDGVIYPTYRDACMALGLLNNDSEFVAALKEPSIAGFNGVAYGSSDMEDDPLFSDLLDRCEERKNKSSLKFKQHTHKTTIATVFLKNNDRNGKKLGQLSEVKKMRKSNRFYFHLLLQATNHGCNGFRDVTRKKLFLIFERSEATNTIRSKTLFRRSSETLDYSGAGESTLT
ncbi:hypothetical protein K1719_042537 [Acacia pycnantha]|nr:hypothetical protein K1719_042537 [Acacia pycnantha]